MVKNTHIKNIFVEDRILKSFLDLINKHHSFSHDNKVFVDIREIYEALDITGGWEDKFFKLQQILEKINLKKLGVRAIEAISVLPSHKEISTPIDKLSECDPNLKEICFEVDENKFNVDINTQENSEQKEYWLNYTKNREVVLNSKYIINIMQFGRASDGWFRYIYEHPNEDIALEKIRKETNEGVSGGFNKFLDNIGFTGQLRKLFFESGKTLIKFYNPITKKDLNERVCLDLKQLKEEIESLRKI